ncbi:MAG: hypothetical protein MI892_24995 [Desulfobacterales bacterium]|nr:hypothetical protein [Desulfobacterales bacterium]
MSILIPKQSAKNEGSESKPVKLKHKTGIFFRQAKTRESFTHGNQGVKESQNKAHAYDIKTSLQT